MVAFADEWTISGLISDRARVGHSNGSPVLGGQGIVGLTGSFERSFDRLLSHNMIYIEAQIKMLGGWKDMQDKFFFSVDGKSIKGFYVETVAASESMNAENDLNARLVAKIPHTSSTVRLGFSWELRTTDTKVSFAISDLSLTLVTSAKESAYSALTIKDSKLTAIAYSSHDYGTTNCPSGFYPSADRLSCFKCDSSCQDCFGPSSSQCFQCAWSYSLIQGKCLQCEQNCAYCKGDTSGMCLLCEIGYTLGFDGVCRADNSCGSSPYVILNNGPSSVSTCSRACPPNTFKYWNNTCLSSCDAPLLQEVDNLLCYYPCESEEYLYNDGSCWSYCDAPLVQDIEPSASFCRSPCKNGEYLYNNGSCLSSCIYKTVFEKGDLFCREVSSHLCKGSQYLYYDGTCQDSCDPPLIALSESGRNLCNIPCNASQYLFDGVCLDSCPSGYVPTVYNICQEEPTNPGNNCSPSDYRYENGTCLPTCLAPYMREGSSCNFPCPVGYYLNDDAACVADCPSSFIARVEGVGRFCSFPCGGDTKNIYLLRDGTCSSTCPKGFTLKSERYNHLCTNPCADEDYLYEDGSCLSYCRKDFRAEVFREDLLCKFPCNSCKNEFLYQNGRCLRGCSGSGLVRPRFEEGDYKFCELAIHVGPKCSDGFLYPNGSCHLSCEFPYTSSSWDGSNLAYCNFPCAPGEYLYEDGTCSTYCREDFRAEVFGKDLLCKFPCNSCNNEFLYSNGSCLNSCSGLFRPRFEQSGYKFCDVAVQVGPKCSLGFLYPDGSCRLSCRPPYESRWDGFNTPCNSPCAPGEYYSAVHKFCVQNCYEGLIRIDDDIIYCDEISHSNHDCMIDFFSDGRSITHCTEPTGRCPIGYFLFEDETCNQICPSRFSPYLNATCLSPCGLNGALYPDGHCSSDCDSGYTTRMEGSFKFCDLGNSPVPSTNESYYLTLDIFVRYDISVSEFNATGGLDKFIQLLSFVLGVDASEIVIVKIREGSTIIESKVKVASGPDSPSVITTKSKAKTMSEKFTNAIQSQALNLEDIPVLNSGASITTPEGERLQVEKNYSKAVIIGVGAGLGVVAVAIVGGYFVYRYKKQRSQKVVETKRTETYRVEVNATEGPLSVKAGNDQEEAQCFAHLPMKSEAQVKPEEKNPAKDLENANPSEVVNEKSQAELGNNMKLKEEEASAINKKADEGETQKV